MFTSAALPVEVRESLAGITSLVSSLVAGETRSIVSYNVPNVSLLARSGGTTQTEDAFAAIFQAAPMLDPFSELVYLRARDYERRTGTFLQGDPLGYRDSANLYAFAGGDPVNERDPRGEAAKVLKNGDIEGIRPNGTRYRIDFAEVQRDPILAMRLLESDPDIGYYDLERIMTEAGLPIPFSSECRVREKCLGGPNNRQFTHRPRGGAGGYVEGIFVGAAGLPPATREQEITASGIEIGKAVVATITVAYGGTKSRRATTIGPRDEEALSDNPYKRGYEVEDVRQRESYTEEYYARSRRFRREADFTDRAGIEKAEVKSLDVALPTYVVTNINNNELKIHCSDIWASSKDIGVRIVHRSCS